MTRTMVAAGFASLLLLPVAARADSAFDGTWKTDASTVKLPKKLTVIVLKDAVYDCSTCVPVIKVAADGAFHPVPGSPYFDAVSIKVVSPTSITETDQKAGKVVSTDTVTVAEGGKTATISGTDSSDTNAAPITFNATVTQVKPGPAGSHAVSGSWRQTAVNSVSDNGMTTTFKLTGTTLAMTTPTGQSYNAPLDGTDVPFKGDPGITSVSLKKLGTAGVVETDKRDGKVVAIIKMVVAANGKTMTVTSTDTLRGRTAVLTAKKE